MLKYIKVAIHELGQFLVYLNENIERNPKYNYELKNKYSKFKNKYE